jgi:ectoine hydroxylase-related dioxygenase (phytanoyl-CoA dioxygenase family)
MTCTIEKRWAEMMIFAKEFEAVNPSDIAKDIDGNGYYAFKSAISPEALRSIEDDATQQRLSLNHNGIGGVYWEDQYFLTHMLAVSKTFFDYCTDPKVLEVCRTYLGDKYRLKALRYYETYGGHHMRWHTDNKTDKGFACIPGLIFIVYISDVEDGEFQYVEGSHAWSGDAAYSEYPDEMIEEKYGNLVRSFKMPRGSIVIYNTYGIHRAKPVRAKGFVRKSLFFQVDNETEKSEPIILNGSFLSRVDPTMQMYLGLGRESGYETFPPAGLNTLRVSRPLVGSVAKWAAYRVVRNVFDLMPGSAQKMLRNRLRA